jgi:hypothetical protein
MSRRRSEEGGKRGERGRVERTVRSEGRDEEYGVRERSRRDVGWGK